MIYNLGKQYWQRGSSQHPVWVGGRGHGIAQVIVDLNHLAIVVSKLLDLCSGIKGCTPRQCANLKRGAKEGGALSFG